MTVRWVRNGLGEMVPMGAEPEMEEQVEDFSERKRGSYGYWLRKFSEMSIPEVAAFADGHRTELSYAQLQAIRDLGASIEDSGRIAFDERKWVVERLEGKAREYVEHTGDAGGLTISFGPQLPEGGDVPALMEGEAPELPGNGDGAECPPTP